MLDVNYIRNYIQDKPEYNRLLDKEEFSDELIQQCIDLAISDFNNLPPESQYTAETFPFGSILLYGILAHLLFVGGLLRARNRLAYQTDGVSIDDEAFADIELQLAEKFRQQFLALSAQKKAEQNVKSGWKIVNSEYSYSNLYWQTKS